MDYLLATDIFLQSGKGVSQITSGTLCYAMGCGCPVICHPFIHAQEAVNSERGILVELGNSTSYSEAIIKLLSDPVLRQELSNNAYNYTRKMIWPRVAESYLDVFQEYLKEGVIAEKTSIGSSFLE
jgi:glycosyltransferase involved in cell wall biosynthesis